MPDMTFSGHKAESSLKHHTSERMKRSMSETLANYVGLKSTALGPVTPPPHPETPTLLTSSQENQMVNDVLGDPLDWDLSHSHARSPPAVPQGPQMPQQPQHCASTSRASHITPPLYGGMLGTRRLPVHQLPQHPSQFSMSSHVDMWNAPVAPIISHFNVNINYHFHRNWILAHVTTWRLWTIYCWPGTVWQLTF